MNQDSLRHTVLFNRGITVECRPIYFYFCT